MHLSLSLPLSISLSLCLVRVCLLSSDYKELVNILRDQNKLEMFHYRTPQLTRMNIVYRNHHTKEVDNTQHLPFGAERWAMGVDRGDTGGGR